MENLFEIWPRNGYVLLEAFTIPKQEGKIILTNEPKYTQIYRVLSEGNNTDYVIDDLVYIKGYPTQITQREKTFYLVEEENIIAKVIL